METVILATTTAVLFGFSDFLGGFASRKDNALAVTARAYLLGVVVMAAAVLLFPGTRVTWPDLAWGTAGGLCGGLGVMSLYAALACGRMSIVAPTTAALSGSLPALFDLVRGTALRPLALLGLGLAIVAVIVVSAGAGEKEEHELPRRALVLSIASGVLFAGAFLSFSFAGDDSGFAPLVAARVVSGVLLTVRARADARRRHARRVGDGQHDHSDTHRPARRRLGPRIALPRGHDPPRPIRTGREASRATTAGDRAGDGRGAAGGPRVSVGRRRRPISTMEV
jgi:uncharacterized membrane protein